MSIVTPPIPACMAVVALLLTERALATVHGVLKFNHFFILMGFSYSEIQCKLNAYEVES